MAKGDRTINLLFPAAGMDRRMGFQSQPPYTTPYALNVRPESSLAKRQRGGSRPGIGRAYRETLGSGNPIRLLAPLDITQKNGYAFWQDTFEGASLGSVWSTASWLTAAPTVSNRTARHTYTGVGVGVVRSAFSPLIATGADYVVEMFIVPVAGRHNGTYTIFCRMDNSTPNATTAGVQARLTMSGTDGSFSGSLLVDGATTYNFTSGTDGFAAAGWFTVRVSGNNVSAYWRGSTLISGQAVGSHSGQRVGFGINPTTSGKTCVVDRFRVQYYRTGQTQTATRRILLASSNGTLYRETELGSMSAISSSLTLNSDVQLQAAQRTQKLYIADYSDWLASGTDGVRGTGNTKFDAASVSDWTTVGIDTDDHVLVTYNSTADTILLNGTYAISSVASGELTLSSSVATSATGTCSWFIVRCPKVYDHEANTLTKLMATSGYGSVPAGCPLICLYRDRIVMAGGADGPHIWYMSRQGDPLDWDYGEDFEDAGRAVAGINTQAGVIEGGTITALIPHADQCLVFGCLSSLWLLRGDPAYGGQIDNLSRRVGVVDRNAWCYVPGSQGSEGLIVFLSQDGLYYIPAGCQSAAPESLSREKLPLELVNIDPSIYDISLAYDMPDRGVHIYVTNKTSGNTTHWWYDWETRGFFMVTLPVTMDPMACKEITSSCSEDSCVVLGCRDGVLRRYHRYYDKDDGNNAISSAVDLGPVMLGAGGGWGKGVLAELQAELGGDTAPVTCEVRGSKSIEQAYNATARYETTLSVQGQNYAKHPRVDGQAAFVRLSNSVNRPWSMESVRVRIQPMGRNEK